MVKFGVFTDVHYAKNIFSGNRRCDLSLVKLKNIVNDFNSRDLDFCVCLGDIINSVQDFEKDILNIKAVSAEFQNFNMPYHIVLGNHDLEAMSKSDFHNAFGQIKNETYYSFVYENTKFILLDANYLSDGSDYCKGNYNWTEPHICRDQIAWLENELEHTIEKDIVVFIHQNLDHRTYEGKADPHLVNNYTEITQLFEKCNKRITVFQGHYHDGDHQKINNISYITLKALCVSNDTSYIPRTIVTIDGSVTVEHLDTTI